MAPTEKYKFFRWSEAHWEARVRGRETCLLSGEVRVDVFSGLQVRQKLVGPKGLEFWPGLLGGGARTPQADSICKFISLLNDFELVSGRRWDP